MEKAGRYLFVVSTHEPYNGHVARSAVHSPTKKTFIDWFFKDAHDKWAVIQLPSPLLWLWLILVIATSLLGSTHIGNSLKLLQSAVLFAWAYLELTDGASNFRKLLGGIIFVVVIAGFFR